MGPFVVKHFCVTNITWLTFLRDCERPLPFTRTYFAIIAKPHFNHALVPPLHQFSSELQALSSVNSVQRVFNRHAVHVIHAPVHVCFANVTGLIRMYAGVSCGTYHHQIHVQRKHDNVDPPRIQVRCFYAVADRSGTRLIRVSIEFCQSKNIELPAKDTPCAHDTRLQQECSEC